VFDLTRLRRVTTPQTFVPDLVYTNIASAHNIVINEETGFAYGVGGSAGGEQCGGGLHMIDIREPKNPKFVGCAADGRTGRRGTGYSHDAVCIVYRGPDEKYTGHEICVGSNETAISVQDVTDKQAPVFLSSASYPFVAYAHQGWFTDDHKYFYLDDEGDEIQAQRDSTGQNKAKLGTRTMVYDMTDLDDPVLVNEYIGTVRSSDHNLYVKGNKLYLANYGSGLRIADISDPVNPREVAYLDTYPDDENQPQMVGAWSTYPYFKSGTIIVTSVTEGLFVVKDRSQAVP
ncbi:MAG TPA: choice-of-anchor B family protein, partial [Mycobacterium sp.]